ncbi:MAG TPA: hypothetical protein VI146_06740 [Nitrososphaeraceae archaeon]
MRKNNGYNYHYDHTSQLSPSPNYKSLKDRWGGKERMVDKKSLPPDNESKDPFLNLLINNI